MSWLSRVLGLGEAVAVVESAPAFIDSGDIDSGTLYGAPTLDDYIFQRRPISRAEALRVPAVKRARDLICGGIGQYPLQVLDPNGKPTNLFSPSLFPQPEPGVAPSVTWTRVVEDMLLFGRGWLQVTSVGWHNRPAEALLLDATTVTIQPEYRYFPSGAAKVWPERPGVIRIDSPNGGLLDASPAIRACILMERAALNHVDGTPPLDYFTPADGLDYDPLDGSDKVAEFLDDWEQYRRDRTTGYVPHFLKYNVAGWDPEKLQLVEAREFAITEVARLTGIDPEDLSVSTTSRTYFNGQDRRRTRIEDVQGPYMTAITGRCSMDDVTPRGFTVAHDTASFTRLDDLSAAQADSLLVAAKIMQRDEARAKRGLEPLGEPAEPVDPAEVQAAHVAAAVVGQNPLAIESGAPRG